MRTMHSVPETSPVLYNENIQDTQPLDSIREAAGNMSDDGIRDMLNSFIGTMNKPGSNHEDDFLLYLYEGSQILKEELAHRTIGTKPHIRWNDNLTKKEKYYDD